MRSLFGDNRLVLGKFGDPPQPDIICKCFLTGAAYADPGLQQACRAMVKRSFPAVVDPATTKVLICGTLPGDRSLEEGRYYAHPRNQFWRLLAPITRPDLPVLGYDERLEALRMAGIGLWDMVATADREGSGDVAIRGHQLNDLPALVAKLPELRALAFNGAKAHTLGIKAMRGTNSSLPLIRLPSSSPAHTCRLTIKQCEYKALANYLR